MPNIKVTRPEFESYWVNRHRRQRRLPRYRFVNDEAAAYIERFATPPTEARKALADTLVGSLKTAGAWGNADAIYLLAAPDAQSHLLNLVQNAYNLIAVNSPAFEADRGGTGDGLTSYYDTGFNPTTAPSPKFTQNSGTLFLWSRTNLANGAGNSFDFGSPNSYIARSVAVAGRAEGRPLTASGQAYGLGSYPGFASFSRTAAAVWEAYAQGIDAGGGTTASAAPSNQTIRICSMGAGSMGVNQIAAAGILSGLSAAQELATFTAVQTYLQAIGAA